MAGVAISFAIFVAIRQFAGPAPSTMTKEYQEMTNEFLRVCLPFFPSFYALPPSIPYHLKKEPKRGIDDRMNGY